MIRINLLPTKRKAARAVPAARTAAQVWLLAMLLVWGALAVTGHWLSTLEEESVQTLRNQAAAKTKQAEQISNEIDEAGLEARKRELEQLKAARDKLESKRRTPVHVMYELAMILTDSKEGGGPDIDEEKKRQLKREDPSNELNERWDPNGLWIKTVTEKGGSLLIEGASRDATDLAEFTRRLRVSARFGRIKHPDFQRVGSGRNDDEQQRYLEWKLDVAVRSWE
jgi:Tfp pilus assembly protein PilN